jgi:hypothetical protein
MEAGARQSVPAGLRPMPQTGRNSDGYSVKLLSRWNTAASAEKKSCQDVRNHFIDLSHVNRHIECFSLLGLALLAKGLIVGKPEHFQIECSGCHDLGRSGDREHDSTISGHAYPLTRENMPPHARLLLEML